MAIGGWQAGHISSGYGGLTVGGQKWLAHRFSYFWHRGVLPPEGQQIHHVCRNRACINPDHLVAVTPNEHRRQRPTKLDPERVRRVHALADEFTYGVLAAKFGVDRTMIGKVRRRERWRDIDAA